MSNKTRDIELLEREISSLSDSIKYYNKKE